MKTRVLWLFVCLSVSASIANFSFGQGTRPASKVQTPASGTRPPASNPPGGTPAATKGKDGRPPPKAKAGDERSAPAQANGTRTKTGQPAWFPLEPQHQEFVDDVLKVWEKKSDSVLRFRCNFVRYTYDQSKGPFENPKKFSGLHACTREQGIICYKSPGMGMIRVETTEENRMKPRAESTGENPGSAEDVWVILKNANQDYWMCDGKSLFFLNHGDQTLVQRPLPPDMQGKAIVNGPLPFIFGAKADHIRERFWVRPLPSEPNEAKLEFVPKSMADAADFESAQVILEEKNKEVLPKAIQLVSPGGGEETVYVLDKRDYNWNETVDKLKHLFDKSFETPLVPKGYKLVREAPVPNFGNGKGQAKKTPNTKSR